MGRTEAERVLTAERVKLMRHASPFAIAREAEQDFNELFDSHERLRAERDLLAAEVRVSRLKFAPEDDCDEECCKPVRDARAAVDAAGCLGEGA